MSLPTDTTGLHELPFVSSGTLELLLQHLLESYVPNSLGTPATSVIQEGVQQDVPGLKNGIFGDPERDQALVFAIDPTEVELQDMVTALKKISGDSKLFIFIHVSKNCSGSVMMLEMLMKDLCVKLACWHHTFLFLPPDLWGDLIIIELLNMGMEKIRSFNLRTLYVQIGEYQTISPLITAKEGGEYDIYLKAPHHQIAIRSALKKLLETQAIQAVLLNLCCEFDPPVIPADFERMGTIALPRTHVTRPTLLPSQEHPEVRRLQLDNLKALTRLHVLKPTNWGNIYYALNTTQNNLEHITFSSNNNVEDHVQMSSQGPLDLKKLKTFHMTINNCILSVESTGELDTALKILQSLRLTGLKDISITWTGSFMSKSSGPSEPTMEQLNGFMNKFVTCLETTVGDAKRGCKVTIRHFDSEVVALMKAKLVPPTNDGDNWQEVVFPGN